MSGSAEVPTFLFSKLAGGGVLDPVAAGLVVLASLPGVLLLLLTERFLRGAVLAGALGR